MPGRNPQVRFVLRASALLIAMLALWWFALQTPMLGVLRGCESLALPNPVTVDPAGDWNFRVPVERSKFRAVEFTIPRGDVVLFTFSLPVFWAIALAGPFGKPAARALMWGTALVWLVEILSLYAVVQITANSIGATPGTLASWSREVANNLIVGVVPFAAPMVIAVAMHRDLRSRIFGLEPLTTRPRSRSAADRRRPSSCPSPDRSR